MDFNKSFQSKKFKIVLITIGSLAVLLFVFKAGVFVGYKKANFSYRWGEDYHRNFGGPRGGFFGDFRHGFGDRDYTNAHGTFGSIIKIDPATDSAGSPQAGSEQAATLIVKGSDNVEKTILVSDKTTITSRRETIRTSDLRVDDRIVIIGSPNEQGQIEAKLIRVFR